MESPIKVWRLEAGLSQEKLADEAGVSLMTVIRNEQALYSSPSSKIIQTLINYEAGPFFPVGVENTDSVWDSYESAYRKYQVTTRSETLWNQGVIVAVNMALAVETHPFQFWRESLGFESRLAFCRAACVSSPQVLNYETAHQRTMPKSIKAALAPFTSAVTALDKAGREYYDATHERSA